MIRTRRLALLLIPLALGLASAAAPGRAQPSTDSRFAFADTTLLRDTLGLRFERLFEIADSLGLLPDTLRALSIRYGFVPARLVQLADSMRVRVDSVGVVLLRERFNPLASHGERITEFEYTTGYNVQQNRNTWTNNADFRISRDALFVHNTTNIQTDRFTTSRRTTLRQTRHAETEVGWRLTDGASVGGRAVLDRFDSDDPSTVNAVGENRGEYQVSLRTRQRPARALSTELNAFTGLLNLTNAQQEKRGGTGEVNGRLAYTSGAWLTNDVTLQVTGNTAKTSLLRLGTEQDTRDLTQSYRGNVQLFPSGRLGFSTDFSYRDFQVQTPDDSGIVRNVRNANTDVSMGLRGRLDNDRQLELEQSFGGADFASAQRSGQSTRTSSSTSANTRYRLFGTSLETRFTLDQARARTPTLSDSGGYGERTETRQLEGSLSRQLATRITGRVTARISLARFRYFAIGRYTSLPIERDQAQQSYRVESAFNPSNDLNTSVGLEVGRTELVNLTSSSVNSNNLVRSYRADWTWTYRLFTGLTATQRNSLNASYTSYPFNEAGDRLGLDYGTTTTLNAVLTPRLTVDLTHNGQEQPSGNYGYQPELGASYFQPADENRNYQLGARVSYTPTPGVTMTAEPRYRATDRSGTNQVGEQIPQRQNRNLTFAGGVNLNIPVGRKGRLTGTIGRSYNADRTTSFSNAVAQAPVRSVFDYWTGNLQFSWRL